MMNSISKKNTSSIGKLLTQDKVVFDIFNRRPSSFAPSINDTALIDFVEAYMRGHWHAALQEMIAPTFFLFFFLTFLNLDNVAFNLQDY